MYNNTEDNIIFEKFAERAYRKIEERKKRRTKKLYNKELGLEIEIRGLSSQEIVECSEYSENSVETDLYTAYYASKTLQDLAEYMVQNKQISKHLEIMDMFSIADSKYLINQVLTLSGIYDKTTFNEVEEIKNF